MSTIPLGSQNFIWTFERRGSTTAGAISSDNIIKIKAYVDRSIPTSGYLDVCGESNCLSQTNKFDVYTSEWTNSRSDTAGTGLWQITKLQLPHQTLRDGDTVRLLNQYDESVYQKSYLAKECNQVITTTSQIPTSIWRVRKFTVT